MSKDNEISRLEYSKQDIAPGFIYAFANNSIPNGYLACDGSAISRTTYAVLFAEIGTTWGVGDGSTTFNIPDLRGMWLRGTGTHGTLTMANTNAFAGAAVGASENDMLQGHYHQVYYSTNAGADGVAPYSGVISGTLITRSPITDGTNGTPRTGAETRPVAYSIKYIIKY